MMLNQSNTEVLTIISQNLVGISTADIFKRLVETYKDSATTEIKQVSKIIFNLRAKNTPPLLKRAKRTPTSPPKPVKQSQ